MPALRGAACRVGVLIRCLAPFGPPRPIGAWHVLATASSWCLARIGHVPRPGSRRRPASAPSQPPPAPTIGRVKLVLLGGAGFRTPAMYEAVHDVRDALGIDELVLYDVDDARLPRVLQVLEGIDRERGSRVAVRATSDLDDALEGADVVYSAIRVGGIQSRIVDETVPLGLGVLGQETTGAGGIAFALRTIPVMREIAERTAERAPGAWFMNFTNPAGMITEAISEVLGDRAFGICDTPRGMFRRIAAALGRPTESLWFDYAGLNHLGYIQGVLDGGVDLLPGLLADDALLATLEEGDIFDRDFLRSLGM